MLLVLFFLSVESSCTEKRHGSGVRGGGGGGGVVFSPWFFICSVEEDV
jgi:hypothetical protein